MQLDPENLRYFNDEIRQMREEERRRTVDGGGGPPHDRSMDERVKKLETIAEKTLDRLTVLERDLAVMKSNYATKEDLHKELHSTTWKIIAAVGALCAAVFWMARNIAPPAPQAPGVTASGAPTTQAPPSTPVK